VVTAAGKGPDLPEPHARHERRYTMSGKTDQIKGRVKESAGALTGDKDLKSEGKSDQRSGKAKESLDHAKGKVEDLTDKAAQKGKAVIDKLEGDS
jgi:uncharacterized protein YjbJ (UPF0337 family)